MAERAKFYDPVDKRTYVNGKRRVIRIIPDVSQTAFEIDCSLPALSESIFQADNAFPTSESLTFAQTQIQIPGLMPAAIDHDGEERVPSNFDHIRDTIGEVLLATERMKTGEIREKFGWIHQLADEVREHKKTAIFTISLGAITILAASVAGAEFGVRHGKDIGYLDEIMQQHSKKK